MTTHVPVPQSDRDHHRAEAVRALREMCALLPSYREVCGEATYLYAVREVERLERELVHSLSHDDLVLITQSITSQLQGLALAIRKAKGRGVELDA